MNPAPTATASGAAGYLCGPVKISLVFDDPSLLAALNGLLSQYDAPWSAPPAEICVTVGAGAAPSAIAKPAGDYLISYRLHVDRRGTRLISLSNVGVWMDYDEAEKKACILVPDHPDRETVIEEVEQQLVLLLARAWAGQGWTPLHAGSLIPPDGQRCILVCAHSGVGKTTLISALLGRGWRTLGDDKLLLRNENGSVVARALSRRMHLHPSLANWFPQVGQLEEWPRYSRWTEKRMVRLEAIWPGQALDSARPAALVQLARDENGPGLAVVSLDATAAMHAVLRQIAIPADSMDAQPLVACAAALTGQLRAVRLTIGNNAFAEESNLDRLAVMLEELLP
jgi:hypothetical protein